MRSVDVSLKSAHRGDRHASRAMHRRSPRRSPGGRRRVRHDAGFLSARSRDDFDDRAFPLGLPVDKARGSKQSCRSSPRPHRRSPTRSGPFSSHSLPDAGESSRNLMKAIVLSAGQGRRLLPLTSLLPKCLLALDGRRSLLQLQLEALARCGISEALVVTGHGADLVETHLAHLRNPKIQVDTIYNPFFGTSDNLISCWLSRVAMDEDFLLLNGDTVFEDAVLLRLLASVRGPLTVTVDHKHDYDDDDMKVALDAAGRVLAIGKTLPADAVGAEAIGLIAFAGSGPKLFVEGLERAVRRPGATRRWYLSVVHELAEEDGVVGTVSIRGLWWREIDASADLSLARQEWVGRASSPEARGIEA